MLHDMHVGKTDSVYCALAKRRHRPPMFESHGQSGLQCHSNTLDKLGTSAKTFNNHGGNNYQLIMMDSMKI